MKTEYYIYNLNGTSLFIFREGVSSLGIWKVSQEYFSGLDCSIGNNALSFFNGKLTLPLKHLRRITKEEFIEYGKEFLENMEQYGSAVKKELAELMNSKYQELRDKDRVQTYKKVTLSRNSYNKLKKSHKRRTANGNN